MQADLAFATPARDPSCTRMHRQINGDAWLWEPATRACSELPRTSRSWTCCCCSWRTLSHNPAPSARSTSTPGSVATPVCDSGLLPRVWPISRMSNKVRCTARLNSRLRFCRGKIERQEHKIASDSNATPTQAGTNISGSECLCCDAPHDCPATSLLLERDSTCTGV